MNPSYLNRMVDSIGRAWSTATAYKMPAEMSQIRPVKRTLGMVVAPFKKST